MNDSYCSIKTYEILIGSSFNFWKFFVSRWENFRSEDSLHRHALKFLDFNFWKFFVSRWKKFSFRRFFTSTRSQISGLFFVQTRKNLFQKFTYHSERPFTLDSNLHAPRLVHYFLFMHSLASRAGAVPQNIAVAWNILKTVFNLRVQYK